MHAESMLGGKQDNLSQLRLWVVCFNASLTGSRVFVLLEANPLCDSHMITDTGPVLLIAPSHGAKNNQKRDSGSRDQRSVIIAAETQHSINTERGGDLCKYTQGNVQRHVSKHNDFPSKPKAVPSCVPN